MFIVITELTITCHDILYKTFAKICKNLLHYCEQYVASYMYLTRRRLTTAPPKKLVRCNYCIGYLPAETEWNIMPANTRPEPTRHFMPLGIP